MLTLVSSALAQGLAIAALAFAFALVYWSTQAFYVLLGGLYVLAPFLAAELQPQLGLGGAAVLAALAASLLSLLLGWTNHEHLRQRGASHGVHFASSLALYFLLSEVMALRWGSEARSLAGLPGLAELPAGSRFLPPASQLVLIVTCAALVAAVSLGVRYSDHGVKIRALADNPVELARTGYNPRLLRAVTFGVSGLVAGGAAVGIAADLAVDTHGGIGALIPAATATLLTPLGRWRRLVAWSLALGILRTAVTYSLSGAWQDPVTLGLLLLGLLGSRRAVRRWPRLSAARGTR